MQPGQKELNELLWKKNKSGPIRFCPQLASYEIWILEGFWRLHNARPSNGMGYPNLVFTEVAAYLDLIGEHCPERRFEFSDCVMAMDAEIRSIVREDNPDDGE